MEEEPPLILCMENAAGEDVALKIHPEDDFQSFLDKARSRLGFDVDLNTITRNEQVNLTDNIYKFLMNAENKTVTETTELNLDILEDNASSDFVYMLDDGTQIDASQIQFENDDPDVEFRVQDLPFTKRKDVVFEEELNNGDRETVVYKIPGSASRKLKSINPKTNFASTLPFKLLTLKAKQFEAQTTRYFNVPKDKTFKPTEVRKVGKDLREEVVNIVKDTAVVTYNEGSKDVRRNVRKTDPSKPVIKKVESPNMVNLQKNSSQYCFICVKFVERGEKLYIFDKEDQKLHRSLPQNKQSDKLKVICESCLESNFELGVIDSPEKTLGENEFLVIRNNQQYVFHRLLEKKKVDEEKGVEKELPEGVEVKTESTVIDVTQDKDYADNERDDVITERGALVKAEEAEIIDESTIENLAEIDDGVQEFLGKCHADDTDDMICRFCKREFTDILDVIEHGSEHKHETDNEDIYPCPLCDYGYVHYTWLKGHLKMAHGKKGNKDASRSEDNDEEDPAQNNDTVLDLSKNPKSPPIATRTRSSRTKKNNDAEVEPAKDAQSEAELIVEKTTPPYDIKVEVKEEPIDDDDGIWILEAEEDHIQEERLEELVLDDKVEKQKQKAKMFNLKDTHKCNVCKHFFISKETLKAHKCTKKVHRKRRINNFKNDDLYEPDEEVTKKQRKKRGKDNPCDPQIVTCNNCNESFTSKVRLKFHMQFHDMNCSSLTEENSYKCTDCSNSNTFTTETELFDHVHFQHPKLKRWHCPVKECGKTFYLRATLTKHSRSHTDTRRYICPSCGKRFLDKQTLDEHGVTHLKIKPFQCHICLKQLTRRSRLRMHLRAHEEALSPALVYVCNYCQRAFKDHLEAQEHATSYTECIRSPLSKRNLSPTTGLIYEEDNAEKNEENLPPNKEDTAKYEPKNKLKAEEMLNLVKGKKDMIGIVEIEKAFRCEYCEDVFYLEDALNIHRSIHKNVKEPFICHICKVTFPTYSRCTTHKTTHGFYKRPLADVVNTSEDGMRSQSDGIRSQPDGMRPQPEATKRHENIPASGILGYGGFPVVKHFLCEDCGRSYLHWTYLQVHRRTKHPGKSLIYECGQCQLTFPNSWSVSYHKKKFHGKSLMKHCAKKAKDFWIPCRDCEEILPNKHALYLHRSKEHCDVSNDIDDNESLNASEKSRLSDRSRQRYFCLVCGHSFRTLTLRTEHLRIHTGEKPFVCQDCGVAFRRLSTFRNHRVTHLPLDDTPKIATVLIEVPGFKPTGEEIKAHLVKNNITVDKVVDVFKISYKQGEPRMIPDNEEEFKSIMQLKTQDLEWKKEIIDYFNNINNNDNLDMTTQNERSFSQMHRPNILQRNANGYPITLNITGEEVSDINVQLLLPEGVLLNGSQMVQLNPHHQLLPDTNS